MAELYTAAGAGERPPAHRPVALHGADRGPLRGRRFPLGARVRRRPAAHRLALLYQLGGAPVHSGRAAQGGRVRAVPGPVRAVWSRRFDPPAVTAALFPSRRGMSPVTERITRREFLELGAGAGLACMAGAACRTAGPVGPARGLAGPAIPPFALQEATLADLARGIESGKYTAHSLCEYYLARIDDLDRRGPTLRSVIETNPDALRIARELDAERKTKGPRGPLHGIPILVKDNIATADRMATTACSLVGIKPTLGLVSRAGIVPIAHSQDTAGPMARTVRDAAILLGALAGPDPRDSATAAAPAQVPDYTRFLDANGLAGARLGVARTKLFGYHAATDALVTQAILDREKLDALVAPTGNPPWPIDLINGDHFLGGSSTPAAVAGFPHVTVPAGYVSGLPVGVSFIGAPWSEGTLVRLAYAYEQATTLRRPPRFLPTMTVSTSG